MQKRGYPLKKLVDSKLGLDELDIKILTALQDNSHQSCRSLASKIGLSSPVASDRVKAMEEKGLLKGYTVLLDAEKLGYGLTVILLVQSEACYVKDLALELSHINNIVTVYEITGDFDLAAVVKLRGRESLNELIRGLMVTPHIKKIVTNVALNVVKEDFRITF
jgi:Lrp/AsnC family transcriptional regulator, regulator for asnA, asnC and gidA